MAGAMDVTSPCADEASRGVTKCLAGCRSVERTTEEQARSIVTACPPRSLAPCDTLSRQLAGDNSSQRAPALASHSPCDGVAPHAHAVPFAGARRALRGCAHGAVSVRHERGAGVPHRWQCCAACRSERASSRLGRTAAARARVSSGQPRRPQRARGRAGRLAGLHDCSVTRCRRLCLAAATAEAARARRRRQSERRSRFAAAQVRAAQSRWQRCSE